MTSAGERVIRPGWEARVPNTPEEFASRWKTSQERQHLLEHIKAYDRNYAIGGEYLEKFRMSRKAQQSKRQYVLALLTQEILKITF